MSESNDNPFPEPVEIEITDSLDLHSFAPRDIRAVVEAYLAEAHKKGFTVVRIIHGKGVGERSYRKQILSANLRMHRNFRAVGGQRSSSLKFSVPR